jgi:3-dehydroquinate dehydratase/shikimate dehydrogenase
MTFIAVSIFVHGPDDVGTALARARQAAGGGARLVEWRIDGLAEDEGAAAALAELVRSSPVPCIVTCRPVWEGGMYGGDEPTRVSLLESLATTDEPARYVDVELAAYERSANLRQKVDLAIDHPEQVRAVSTSLILSAHDFEGRPHDLLRRIEAMTEAPACAVIKIAWRARSLRDNLEAFDVLRERRKPTIALCMGEFGLMSRVLAPKFGGLLTFASDVEGEETAPGQPTVHDLIARYRFEHIGPATKVYGVIGWPVGHSRGPDVHNAAFAHAGHDGVYLPLPVPPEYEHFKASLACLVDHDGLDFRGASVTIPHKTHLVRFVEERGGTVEVPAARCGAANTLVVEADGALACTNTDGAAAVGALTRRLPRLASGTCVAVIGAGGVARAITAELAAAGAEVILFNRTRDRAEALVESLGDVGDVCAGGSGEARLAFDAIVNCTPVGMEGGSDPHGLPLPEGMVLGAETVVLDTVYTPVHTPLIRAAEEVGAPVVTGLEMFVRQAKAQSERWVGAKVPKSVFTAVLE